MYLETVSRRYTYRGARCKSNALLWLRNIGRRPERTLWHLFPRAMQSSVLIQVKKLNPFNSGPRAIPKGKEMKGEIVIS